MSWQARILTYKDEDDWLTQRREGIGASDIAKILGVSPYGSAFTVWADKVHGAEERQTSDNMELGKRREGVILEDFELESGLFVRHRQLFVAHPRFDWMRATLDGLVFESPVVDVSTIDREQWLPGVDSAVAVVEAKHDGSFKRWETIPDHHQIQVQWQLAVTGLENGFLAVWHSGRYEQYEITADPGLQNMMVDRANDFRARHITGGVGEATPPDPDDSRATAKAIADLWDADPDKTIELAADAQADLQALRGLKLRIRDLESEKKRLEHRLKVAMQDATVATVDGQTVFTLNEVNVEGHWRDGYSFRRLDLKKAKETK